MQSDMFDKTDLQELTKTIDADILKATEEEVTIKRYASTPSEAPESGIAPTLTFTLIKTTACVDDIGIEAVKQSAGVYALGDLVFQVKIALIAPVPATSTVGDHIIYEGVEYRIVQKPMTEYLGGTVYYSCIARRVNNE